MSVNARYCEIMDAWLDRRGNIVCTMEQVVLGLWRIR